MRSIGTIVLFLAACGQAQARTGARSPVAGEPGLRITIRIGSPEAAPAATLARAERLAGAILARTGIDVQWQECPCRTDPEPATFWVHLLSRRPANLHGDAAGYAVLMPAHEHADPYAGIFYPTVVNMAGNLDAEAYEVLAAALAHEIGHLLLGSGSHSRTGVMNPRIDREQISLLGRGELLFTPEQGARLRQEVARRIRVPRY